MKLHYQNGPQMVQQVLRKKKQGLKKRIFLICQPNNVKTLLCVQ